MKRKREPKSGSVTREIAKINRQLGALKVEVEMKYSDITGNNSVTTTGFVNQAICQIVQGTTATTRVGNSIAIHAFEIISEWYLPSVTPDYNNLGRFILVEDKASAGASLTVSSVISSVMAPVSIPFLPKFKLHYDHYSCLSQNGPSNEFHRQRVVFKRPKLIQFSASSGTAADIAVRNFVVIGISDSTVATNPGHSFWVRVAYKDA